MTDDEQPKRAKRCETCAHYDNGDCRRFPPVAYMDEDRNGYTTQYHMLPGVAPDEWCGEWAPSGDVLGTWDPEAGAFKPGGAPPLECGACGTPTGPDGQCDVADCEARREYLAAQPPKRGTFYIWGGRRDP